MTTASKITLARIAMIPIFMVYLYAGNGESNLWTWLAFATFILASLTDMLDGYVARHYNQVSDFGKFLDPLADKLLTIAAMAVFCEWGIIPGWALMIVLTREFAVTGLRLVAVGKGDVIAAAWSGKIKTAVTMVGLLAIMAMPHNGAVHTTVIALIVVTTVYSGVEYFINNWKCLW